MNLGSCKKCGMVVDLDKVEFIEMEVPDDPEDEKLRDEDGYLPYEVETHYNEDLVWSGRAGDPLETWQCRICKEFNGKGEE